jgi:hypothetical protein
MGELMSRLERLWQEDRREQNDSEEKDEAWDPLQ